MTPVVLLIDVLAPTGWQLPEERLVDTLLGCAIVLLVGSATWPSSWHSHLPWQFAATLRDLCRSMEAALVPDPDPAVRGRGGQPAGRAMTRDLLAAALPGIPATASAAHPLP